MVAPESSGTASARFGSKLCTLESVLMVGSGEKVETRTTPRLESCVIGVRPWRPQTSCTLLGEVTRTNLSSAERDSPNQRNRPHKRASTLKCAIEHRPA